jgi:hypothetical protein
VRPRRTTAPAPSGPGDGTCQASLADADITTGLAGELDLDLAI